MPRLRAPAKTSNTVKVWRWQETAIAPILTMAQSATLLRTPSPIMPGKGVIPWNLQWNVPPECVSYFTSLGKGELLNLHWYPNVLLQVRPAEMYYT